MASRNRLSVKLKSFSVHTLQLAGPALTGTAGEMQITTNIGIKEKIKTKFYETGAVDFLCGTTGGSTVMYGYYNGELFTQALGAIIMFAVPSYKVLTLNKHFDGKYGHRGSG